MSGCSECGKNYSDEDVLIDEGKRPSRQKEVKAVLEELSNSGIKTKTATKIIYDRTVLLIKSLAASVEGGGMSQVVYVTKCNECPLSGPFNYGDKCDIAPKVTRIGGAMPTKCPLVTTNANHADKVQIGPHAEIRSHQ